VSRYLLDSNLLVLLVVGRVDRELINRHRRLKQFVPEDYDRLTELLSESERILVTPNTLTETSNLLAVQRGATGTELAQELGRLIEQEIEVVVPSRDAASRAEFVRLGLADSAMIHVATGDEQLLTADMKLYGAAVAVDPTAAVYFVHSAYGR